MIRLVKHDLKYVSATSALSSDEHIKSTLGMKDHQVSIEGTTDFFHFINEAEARGEQLSRIILNEHDEVVGITTLKDIDHEKKTCYIGSWIGYPFWGKGYNESSKQAILNIAFNELNLEKVFAGAKLSNQRSIRAQEKLGYVTLDVGSKYPDELEKIEQQTGEKCQLNVIYKEDFSSRGVK